MSIQHQEQEPNNIIDIDSLNGQYGSKAATDSRKPIIIISREHKLLPLAHRLRNVEGWPTEVVVWKSSYEKAWEGMLEKDVLSSKREIHESSVSNWLKRIQEDILVAVNDVPNLAQWGTANNFARYSFNATPVSVRLGCWYQEGTPYLPHLLVYDMGAWPGGIGMRVPGGLTLIACLSEGNKQLWYELFNNADVSILENFNGLTNVGLVESQGKLVLEGWETGWPDLHTQVFMSAVEGSWGQLLTRGVLPVFTNTFTVGLPVTVPPWPGSGNTQSQGRGIKDIEIDLNPKLHKHVYWHDVKVQVEEKKLLTAGLDGLVGVVHANSDSFENALQKALGISNLIGLSEKQYRSDIGGGVRMLESQLNEHYGCHF